MNALKILSDLISFKSITPNEASAFAYISNILSDFKRLDLNAPGEKTKNVLFYKLSQNKNSEHLCFCTHIDVVPPGEHWTHDPFVALQKDGAIYGRGAQDMKSGLACAISALKNAKSDISVSLLITSDEEGDGTFGTKYALDLINSKYKELLPTSCIVTEPTCEAKMGDKIKIGRRGSINGKITIFGKQGHVAYPRKCINPIELLGARLGILSGNHLDSGMRINVDNQSFGFAPSKFVITNIHAGIGVNNVTPNKLEMLFNVRNNPSVSLEDVKNHIKNALDPLDYELEIKQSAEAFLSSAKAPIVSALMREIQNITNITPSLDTGGGTSDAKHLAKLSIPVVEFGVRNDTIHAINERVFISDVKALEQIFTKLLENLC
ncbi:MAG: succinyl-diaminopimelate desuccinylase [Helicobacter sp.]|nr:succinyl-diaminopimelate desuccinylase [Helicobacter sp.]